ncbi:MAG: tetrahydromethanopterin S-methyltransferase subunit E [Methanosarcina flavescens]|jgi:tetrahydromethanopterin S-methyltransferase subunit E|uniref:Tetrahydromethanopterin S-methyltransferase subunit E n=1 Tax=Methanosarcina flavescens TaxID=1715806 RepID=A0A660HU30_9EURY|nr:tetrahydromethanopterin S-methyltransferase subunit E [Methanosarcina flavescens]AYK15375.1 tetrahydromethanopterin S-methyltransferase subunit E [Methanosarcina flavescens]NLK33757.1 tetrahydromethanopterin S-methyltransferase subunit E [Methanosarcina flavescens]
MEPLVSMGVLALIGVAATIAGVSEDLESDIGSQSNPNSQVQLAPQMAYPHRIFNKAISGEPPSNALMCSIGAAVATVLISVFTLSPLFALVFGSLIAACVHGTFAVTATMGRCASQSRFKQPIYLDMIRSHVPAIMGFAFITTFCVLVVSYLMTVVLGHPFPLAMLAFIWGITIGAIGSSTGDVHYGAEREFQQFEFGSGLNASNSGNIVRYAESGLRNGFDNSWFCAKFGGPVTGIAFGMTVFLGSWITTIFDPTQGLTIGWLSVAVGVIIVLILIIWNWKIEVAARKAFGPYKEDKAEEASA